jgi:hypothetical protein
VDHSFAVVDRLLRSFARSNFPGIGRAAFVQQTIVAVVAISIGFVLSTHPTVVETVSETIDALDGADT